MLVRYVDGCLLGIWTYLGKYTGRRRFGGKVLDYCHFLRVRASCNKMI